MVLRCSTNRGAVIRYWNRRSVVVDGQQPLGHRAAPTGSRWPAGRPRPCRTRCPPTTRAGVPGAPTTAQTLSGGQARRIGVAHAAPPGGHRVPPGASRSGQGAGDRRPGLGGSEPLVGQVAAGRTRSWTGRRPRPGRPARRSAPMAASSGAKRVAELAAQEPPAVGQGLGQPGLERCPQPGHLGGLADRVEEPEPLVDEGGHPVGERCVRCRVDGQQRQGPRQLPGDRLAGQVVGVLEVAEQRPGGDAGPLGDLVGARPQVPLRVEVEQRVDHGLAVERPAESPPVRLGGASPPRRARSRSAGQMAPARRCRRRRVSVIRVRADPTRVQMSPTRGSTRPSRRAR